MAKSTDEIKRMFEKNKEIAFMVTIDEQGKPSVAMRIDADKIRSLKNGERV